MNNGRFKKGIIPWNKGLSWTELSERRKGEGNPMFGKKLSEDQKQSIRERALEGGYGKWMIGKKRSPETLEKFRATVKSKYDRIGRITPFRMVVRRCFKYKQWRADIFERDKFTCQKCEAHGVYLEADHYPKLFSQIMDEFKITTLDQAFKCQQLWDINNGRTLCRECHNKTKNGRKKI